jgi:hypothetical protein
MKKKRLENREEIQEKLAKNETIEKKDFTELLKRAVKPSSQRPA